MRNTMSISGSIFRPAVRGHTSARLGGEWYFQEQCASYCSLYLLFLLAPNERLSRRFMYLHHEKLPSAIQRYQNEVRRVLGVLETHLNGREWLVGNKMTYADIAWVPWNMVWEMLFGDQWSEMSKEYPNVIAWHERLTSRAPWKKAMELRTRLMNQS
jgi:glutathione S-transferase